MAKSEFGKNLEELGRQYQNLKSQLIENKAYQDFVNKKKISEKRLNNLVGLKDDFYEVIDKLNDLGINPNIPSGLELIGNSYFDNSIIFSYDGPHEQFFQELIAKNHERFKGTEIFVGSSGGIASHLNPGASGEIQGNLIKRSKLTTTIYNDSNLRSANLWPITPEQSEYLLQDGKLTNSENTWEDLALILYDGSQNGYNPKEAQAIYDSLRAHRQDLGLSESDLENKLIIVNAGAEVDLDMSHGVKPIVLPGLTQVYQHEVLEKVGEDPNFDGYGLNGGLPLLNQLGSGSRKLCMPIGDNIGLRLLRREWDLDLGASCYMGLACSHPYGRINFAPNNIYR